MIPDKKSFRITHVAGVEINPNGGMGRVAFHWRAAFLSRAHSFRHVGPEAVGACWHYSTFGPQAARLVRREVVHSDALLLHESAAWAFRSHQCPKIVFSHGLEARFSRTLKVFEDGQNLRKRMFAALYQWLIMQGIRRADLVLVLNSEDRSCLEKKGVDPSRLKIFRNGVAGTDLAKARQVTRARTPLILFNASWIRRKGTAVLVEAARLLYDAGLNVNWMLVGTGFATETVLNDWPGHLRSYVTVVPRFSPDDESRWLEQADMFVLPSYFEGQPLSLLQAMESGLPCVTTNCCGQRDVIDQGRNGYLVAPGDSEGLFQRIKMLIGDPELRFRMGQAAAETVKEQSWETVSNEVVDEVRDVIVEKTC